MGEFPAPLKIYVNMQIHINSRDKIFIGGTYFRYQYKLT
jgi:hypothetical protein